MSNEKMMTENLNELFSALSKAQSKIQHALKDKNNPFFKSKYADLASVWEACRDPLTSNGLSVIQTVEGSKEAMYLITILGHSSGQFIKSSLPILLQKLDPQSVGSAITYCRRYSLSAIAGICPEDDDGEKAMNRNTEQKNTLHIQKKPIQNQQKITKEQYQLINDMIGEDRIYREKVMKFLITELSIDNLEDLPVMLYDRVMSGAQKNHSDNLKKSGVIKCDPLILQEKEKVN